MYRIWVSEIDREHEESFNSNEIKKVVATNNNEYDTLHIVMGLNDICRAYKVNLHFGATYEEVIG